MPAPHTTTRWSVASGCPPWPGLAIAGVAALALHLGAWAGWAALARSPAAGVPLLRADVLAVRVIAAPPRSASGAGRARSGANAAAPRVRQSPASGLHEAAASPDLPSRYLPSRGLDRPALPKSAPDLALLEGLSLSGLPIRLRLYIEATGEVSAAELLAAGPDDAEAVQRIRRMFLATAFVPGLRHGREVASFKDVELRLGP